MAEKINLMEIERKVWTSYFQDGFWEIFFGLMALTAGLRGLTDNVLFTFGILLAVLVSVLGKKYITVPRMGMVRFSNPRRDRQIKMFVLLGVSIVALLVLMIIPGALNLQISTSPIMAVWIALIFGLLAYLLEFKRLFVYGLFFAGSEAVWGMFGMPLGPIAHLVSGIIILAVGLVVLTRFLKKYPLPAGVKSHGKE